MVYYATMNILFSDWARRQGQSEESSIDRGGNQLLGSDREGQLWIISTELDVYPSLCNFSEGR